jgi:hypothetical protein
MWIDPQTGDVAHTHSDIRTLRPNWSAGLVITDEHIAAIEPPLLPVTQTASGHDPLTQTATELAPVLDGDEWVQRWEVTDKPQEQVDAERQEAIAVQWEKIKAERDGPRVEGGVLVGAHWFHTDAASRIKWLGVKDSARDVLAAGGAAADRIEVRGKPLAWKTMAGTFVPVTVQLTLDVVQAVKDLDAAIFECAEIHNATMRAAKNPAAYDYSTGWPDRYTPDQQQEE